MKILAALVLALAFSPSLCHAQPLDTDSIHERVKAERRAFKGYFDETAKLLDVFKDQKNDFRATEMLMDTVNRLQERTDVEESLLAVYDCVTNVAAQQDAEQIIRKFYASFATLTDIDVDAAALVLRSTDSKELIALAEKVKADTQKITDRYRALSKE